MQLVVIVVAAVMAAANGRALQSEAKYNDIEPREVLHRQSTLRKFVALTRRPPAVTTLAPGGLVELTCEAIGAPAPTIHWFKNDAPVYEHDAESSEALESSAWSLGRVSSTLLVRRAQRDRYVCAAVAGLNVARANAIVYTKDASSGLSERAKLTPLAPRILVTYKVFFDVIGSTITLPCKARGHPRPVITWTDNKGQPIKRDNRMKVLRSGELVLSDLRWSDMGEYSCRADNANGSQLATTFVYPAKAG